MKAISLMQPWGWLMTHGLPGVPMKDIENRKWSTSFRGPVLVHASKQWDSDSFYLTRTTDEIEEFPDFVPDEVADWMPKSRKDYPIGGIVGMFTITDVVTKSDNPWFFGPYGFVVKDARPLPFTPLRGQLNFFEVSDEIVRQTGLDPALYADNAKQPVHTCHAEGCNKAVPPKTMMCAYHWRMVPRELQREVWRYYRPGQEADKRPSPDYLVAAGAAKLAVKQKEAAITGQLSFGL